ncbi:urease accessory protein UreH domain-containing protein [Cellulomonas bogoriensis]|uniref:HMA domain-containing protein n=1 Tax=Cellulomonas bogoriensis 69B4 = DSM 16987 TaxID=1386082 RepID=A0A0A0BZL9_9CELL|nr:sulfite exporter TauE/SafE family protein [Cellulomonas bogoriensis]KGM13828.1 hypothetical protein N869_09315 [Cellulomonas bogoriensis 69B4 = DSM 16987]
MPTTVPITGMTCRACEVRVGKALRKVPGVDQVSVSASRGRATVTTSADIPRARLVAAIEKAGYRVGDEERAWLSRDRAVWRDVAVAAVVVALLAAVATAAGLDELAGGLDVGSGGLVVAVLLGLAAGLSTCMALVGGLVLAVSARHAERHPQAGPWERLRPHLAFNLGRVVGFGVLGAGLGVVGSAVQVTGGALALMTLVVALAMVAIGLQLTSVSPRLSRLTPSLPASVATRLGLDSRGGRYHDGGAAALGAASFLLPCGFTQVVQLYALSTGDAVRAGVVMALFALGTAPGLLGVGGAAAAARGAFAPRFFRFAGVAVLAFAAVNVSGALTVLAPSWTAPAAAGSAVDSVMEGDVQVLRTVQVVNGYEPAQATVVAGTPVRWEIESTSASCASALYAPAMGVNQVLLLEPGANTIEFTPTAAGRMHYSCSMGMYVGVIDVVDPPEEPVVSPG